ncbi:MAG: YlxR family protein [Spirulinaceae cyanobacterium RM2_2_10]|nr:YlxR family protein [Spirulinaceae cyanobacterium SM2_1_0]NJO20974.1 YlxR family protein [Spirulinaceae cyanobacterium RM2_2_10]
MENCLIGSIAGGRGASPTHVNLRRCVVCRHLAPKATFWRIVRVYPSLAVQLDRGMGRSAYLCPQASCLQAAQRRDRLGRSLKTAVPPALYQQLWERLALSPPEPPVTRSQAADGRS